ncbi:Venom allergen 5 [Blattella germanica]|nr:Venom allergen 5 [Blattella germanica]
MQTLVLLSCLVVAATAQTCSYSSICADHTICKYSGYGSSCGTVKYSGVTSAADQKKVVDAHNRVRSLVALAFCTINFQVWDNELATVAQRWAEQCSFGHDSCRNVGE